MTGKKHLHFHHVSLTDQRMLQLRTMPSVSRRSRAGAKLAGCEGILVYTDNGQVDPWLVAQPIIRSDHAFSPSWPAARPP